MVLVLSVGAAAHVRAQHPAPENPPHAEGVPHIVLETDSGAIDIELLPDAAPRAVARLVRLVEGPVFAADLTGDGPHDGVVGYYDGLEFDRALPKSYLATGLRPPGRAVLIPTEIDADALGLDQKKITSTVEATDVWQLQLFPYRTNLPSDQQLDPLMRTWLEQWGKSFNADFLVGVSWKDVDEALGYHYTKGLASRHVTRGAVFLESFDRLWSTPRMVIALRDMPERDGRQMVVGHVVSGLDLADKIAARPLSPAKEVQLRPLVPVRILRARVESRGGAPGGAGTPKGEEESNE